ncbi:MAG TPA: hypothetical protein VMI92_05750 [Steroidobacteraceae bacterium]|nr:hypothetical protein [Steroidobacteraceae bacterium]
MTATLKVVDFTDRNVPVLEPASVTALPLRSLPPAGPSAAKGWDATEVWRTRIKPALKAKHPPRG